jgi:hypothetical protein
MSIDWYSRALESYEASYSRLLQARQAWADEGRPLLHTFANGMTGVSPHLKALRLCEADAARGLEALRIRHPGPSATAVISATLPESPAQRLRVVEPVAPPG